MPKAIHYLPFTIHNSKIFAWTMLENRDQIHQKASIFSMRRGVAVKIVWF